MVPTAAVVAVPSTPPPFLPQGQPASGTSLSNVAGDKPLPRPAGQPQVSASDIVIRQNISFSSQSGRNSTAHSSSPSSSKNTGRSSPKNNNSQSRVSSDQHQQGGARNSVDFEGRSPKFKSALFPYSSSSPEPKRHLKKHKTHSSQQSQSIHDHSHSQDEQQERSLYENELSDEESPQDPLYSTVKTSLYSRVRGKGNRDKLITQSVVEGEAGNQSSDSESDVVVKEKKEPVYTKVVKKLSHLKPERRKSSSGDLPPKAPSSLKQKQHQDKRKGKLPPNDSRREASVRFADKEEEHRKESQVHEDLEEDAVGRFVEEDSGKVARKTNAHSIESGYKWGEETTATHYEQDWKGSRVHKTTKYSPTVSYSQNNISKVVLPMGYKGDQDELEYREDEYQQSTSDSKTLSLNLTDEEDEEEEEEDAQAKHLNYTYPPPVKTGALTGIDGGPRLHSSMAVPSNHFQMVSDRERGNIRPASVPPTLDVLPVIKPSVLKKASTSISSDVYVFSERRADGKMQYFAASPVHYATTTGFTTDPNSAAVPNTPLETQTSVSMGSGPPIITQSVAYRRESRPTASPFRIESYSKENVPFSAPSQQKPSSVTASTKKGEKREMVPRTSTPVYQNYGDVPSNLSVTKISAINGNGTANKSAVPEEIVSSSSSISLDDSVLVNSRKWLAREGIDGPITGKHVDVEEMEANTRRIQELVDLLAAERKTVEAEKHISELMRVRDWYALEQLQFARIYMRLTRLILVSQIVESSSGVGRCFGMGWASKACFSWLIIVHVRNHPLR